MDAVPTMRAGCGFHEFRARDCPFYAIAGGTIRHPAGAILTPWRWRGNRPTRAGFAPCRAAAPRLANEDHNLAKPTAVGHNPDGSGRPPRLHRLFHQDSQVNGSFGARPPTDKRCSKHSNRLPLARHQNEFACDVSGQNAVTALAVRLDCLRYQQERNKRIRVTVRVYRQFKRRRVDSRVPKRFVEQKTKHAFQRLRTREHNVRLTQQYLASASGAYLTGSNGNCRREDKGYAHLNQHVAPTGTWP